MSVTDKKPNPPVQPAMIAQMRILLRDGTPEGTTLVQMEQVHAAAIPREYSKLRVHNREGKYQVIEDGILYFYLPRKVCVTVIVDLVPEIPVEWEEDEAE